ncbi:MAG: DUF29 family protein [Dolichospermum sp.]
MRYKVTPPPTPSPLFERGLNMYLIRAETPVTPCPLNNYQSLVEKPMEELLELKTLLTQGNVPSALALVEEMTEMSKDDKINKISSYAKILLLHLIKQQAEKRTTRSWDLSIENSIDEIQKTNRRRKSGGTYLSSEELREALTDAYRIALAAAAAEAFEGSYSSTELSKMIDYDVIISGALDLITKESQ